MRSACRANLSRLATLIFGRFNGARPFKITVTTAADIMELILPSDVLTKEICAMPLQPTKNIWYNGKLIPWDQANIHVMSHVIHYGSSVFEGIRCYKTEQGAAIFRLQDHMQRMLDSAKIYRMDLGYSLDQISDAVVETVESNGVAPCYIRPMKNPIEFYIANFPWGKYVSGDRGADICISSWNRMAPNTLPVLAKAGANYMNSQLIHMEAKLNGFDEGVGLDVNGLVSEGSGENLFVVHKGQLLTADLGSSVLAGITRSSILTLARDFGIPVVEQPIPRELLYIADEVFFTGTAAEVTPIRSIDRITIQDGQAGPITKQLAAEYFGIVSGQRPDRFNWLTPVKVAVAEPVSA
jgi:branched-chain amino acid aminotransferase